MQEDNTTAPAEQGQQMPMQHDSTTDGADTQSSSSSSGEPIVNIQPECFEISVKSQDGNEIRFKIRPTSRFGKVVDAYCKRSGVERDTVRFLFDGQRLEEDKTIGEIGLQDGDEVDAMVSQIGG